MSTPSTKIPVFKKVVGLEVFINDKGVYELSYVIVQRKKQKLKIISKQTNIQNFKELEQIPKNIPVSVSITGKGIMLKDDSLLNQSTFRSATAGSKQHQPELYTQSVDCPNDNVLYTYIRKEKLDGILQELQDAGLNVITYYIGPLIVSSLSNFTSGKDSRLSTKSYQVTFSDSVVVEIIKNTDLQYPLNLNESTLEPIYILPFACAYAHLSSAAVVILSDQTDQLTNVKRYYNYSKLLVYEKIVLVGFFVIVLLNYLLFIQLNQRTNKLNFETGEYNKTLKEISELQAKIDKEKKVIELSGLDQTASISFYADRIASSKPQGINLTRFTLFPVKKGKKINEIIIEKSLIKIMGITENSNVLNDWITKMKKNLWISNIELVRYEDLIDAKGDEFELDIKIKQNDY